MHKHGRQHVIVKVDAMDESDRKRPAGCSDSGSLRSWMKHIKAVVNGLKSDLQQIGTRIMLARKSKGFSQNSFAKACRIDRTYYGGIERGEYNFTYKVLARICLALHTDIPSLTQGLPSTAHSHNYTAHT